MVKKRYGNIFLLSGTMWDGNVSKYFLAHSKNMVIFYLLPRWEKRKNFVRVFRNGKLIKHYSLFSPKNIILQYIFLFPQTMHVMLRHFAPSEHFYIISFHPFFFLTRPLLRPFRRLDIIFWVIDYFPNAKFPLSLYQASINYFHRRNKYNIYLSNRLNKVMNKGKIVRTLDSKTIMWGVKKPRRRTESSKKPIWLYYNGVIRDEHGFEILFNLVRQHKNVSLKLLGACQKQLYKKYKKMIRSYGIEKNIFFPNKYFTEDELVKESKNCLAAIALYVIDKNSYVYYADPGKIKLYVELGLPIIMTKSSEIASYIARLKAGEVIEQKSESIYNAVSKIADDYGKYIKGVERFGDHFYYENYYREKFTFLESR